MSTITNEQEAAITDYLATHYLPVGIGTEESACSIAAINLALTGELTDAIPPCMSPVVGKWIIETQDAISDTTRNSDAWKRLLPLAAGTGREHEAERLAIVTDAMWVMLATVQPVADEGGYGAAWRDMLSARSTETAHATSNLANGAISFHGSASPAGAARKASSASAAASRVTAYADAVAANSAAYAASVAAAYADAKAASLAATSAALAAALAAEAVERASRDRPAYGQWAIETLQLLVA